MGLAPSQAEERVTTNKSFVRTAGAGRATKATAAGIRTHVSTRIAVLGMDASRRASFATV
jgi:hypothetical protein